jgi:hypothetical protein
MSNEEQNGFFAKPVLSEVVSEAILNDAQIKALNQRLNELVQYNSPRYVQQTNGEFKAVNSVQFDEAFEKIKEQIVLRQEQIMSAYNFR